MVAKSEKKAKHMTIKVLKTVAKMGVPVRSCTRPSQGGKRRSRANTWKMRDMPYRPVAVEVQMPMTAPSATM